FEQTSFNGSSQRTSFTHYSADLRLGNVSLILRNSDSRENTDDRNHDHQLDKGKTFLHLSFHFSTPFVFQIAVGLTRPKQETCQDDTTSLAHTRRSRNQPRICVAVAQ